jgi:glycosyltransferase involved in cell wall biosynthesis
MQFSILLPVRNGGDYLKECVSSILNQSYGNFLLHILDNNSTDGSMEWVGKINDPRIKIYFSKTDLTIEENWARIVDIPKSEFMTLIGHDDILFPDFLLEMNELIHANSDASLWHAHFNYIDAEGAVIRPCLPMADKLSIEQLTKHVLNNEIDITGTGYVMRSSDYEKIGGIPVRYPFLLFADFELWMRLTSLSYEVISSKELCAFRIHNSTTTTSKNEAYIKAFQMFTFFLNTLKNESNELKKCIEVNTGAFVNKYLQRLSFRIVKTDMKNRKEGESVKYIFKLITEIAHQLNPAISFNPKQNMKARLALWIDSGKFTRRMFLWYKQIFPKAILK